MDTGTLISLDEYLTASYEPDREYVDGVLLERNVGDWIHALIQSNIIFALRSKYRGIYAVPELRSRTTATRYRLPDVCVVLTAPETTYLLAAAFIAIEILSADDRMSQVLEKLAEYEAAGVAHIWLIDPRLELMSVYSNGTLSRVSVFQAGEIELTRDETFAR